MSNKSIGTNATMGIDIGKNSFRGAGGSLPPDSCRPMPMARTVAVGTEIAPRPPHRSVRAAFPHTAPTSGE
jgi:hypothetical protein